MNKSINISSEKFVELLLAEAEKFSLQKYCLLSPKIKGLSESFQSIILQMGVGTENPEGFSIDVKSFLENRVKIENTLSVRADVTRLEAELPYEALLPMMFS